MMEFIFLFIIIAFVIIKITSGVEKSIDQNEEISHKEAVKTSTSKPPPTTEPDPTKADKPRTIAISPRVTELLKSLPGSVDGVFFPVRSISSFEKNNFK